MQYINHWPDMAQLTLPEDVSQDLYGQLLEPFDSIGEAKEFWEETSTPLIILTPADTIEDIQGSDTWPQIVFALTYPEYTVPLSMGYKLSVTIVNDSGIAIFLVIPPELSPIISIEKKQRKKQRHPMIKKAINLNSPQPVFLFQVIPVKIHGLFSKAAF